MIKRATIQFVQSEKDIAEPVTKFGGQPYWINGVQWPISRECGKPMRFICQIALTEDLFPDAAAKMAYIFMTDDFEDAMADTWEADGGENTVILQPGSAPSVPVEVVEEGPSLVKYVQKPSVDLLQPEPVIFTVELKTGEDPEPTSEAASGNKIGGTPGFLQTDEYPDDTTLWKLLLQLDSTDVPFDINFGDAGIGYAFVNEDATIGKFLWQCA